MEAMQRKPLEQIPGGTPAESSWEMSEEILGGALKEIPEITPVETLTEIQGRPSEESQKQLRIKSRKIVPETLMNKFRDNIWAIATSEQTPEIPR